MAQKGGNKGGQRREDCCSFCGRRRNEVDIMFQGADGVRSHTQFFYFCLKGIPAIIIPSLREINNNILKRVGTYCNQPFFIRKIFFIAINLLLIRINKLFYNLLNIFLSKHLVFH